MKVITITAVLGALVALPLIFGKRKPALIPVPPDRKGIMDPDVRYDTEDFLT